MKDIKTRLRNLIDDYKDNQKDIKHLSTITIIDLENILNELESLSNRIERASSVLNNYRHYTTPDEFQNSQNEDVVYEACKILNNEFGDKDVS